jgi:murein L,D-transpeptidase YcbB/YkuD
MKKICTCAAFICSFFIACTQNSGDQDTFQEKTEKDKKISKRDLSITSDNAYNDLFLDSMNVVDFITKKNLSDSISRRIKSFYNARNYQYAWFSSSGLTEQTLGFWNLYNYAIYSGDTSLKDKVLQKKMDRLIADSDLTVNASDKSIRNTELSLTQHFIEYILDNYEKGFVKRKELERFVPLKKENVMMYCDSLLTHKHKDNKYFDDVNESYKKLKEELAKYYEIARHGGWPMIAGNAKEYKKDSSPLIVNLKKRLQITGDMPAGDSSAHFTDTLKTAIKQFQYRLGYTTDGIITTAFLKDLNVPVEQRLKQILVNMNRMRWMPQQPEGKLILVNIPEFVLHFFDGKNKIFDMDVVVGKEGHNTMMFTGKLSQIVFSPYWNVPPGIVEKEILPHMASDPNYLEEQDMEITGKDEDGLPVIRQRPGEKNSLGKVKFLFPNSFNIYFHDTPSKELFNKDKRAYSHGCIRLSDPLKLAEYLLKDDSTWPPEKIMEAMDSGNEKYVKVKNPVPVFITYYTAWVDENNQLNFRNDIYGRDSVVAKKMFY